MLSTDPESFQKEIDGLLAQDVNRLSNGTSTPRRLGILGMKERVEQVGGEFTVESRLGNGTTLFVRIPLLNTGEAG